MANGRAFLIDAGAIAAISIGICTASDRLAFMTALVPATVAIRFALWSRLPRGERGSLARELAFFALCTAVGAFNDWSSVDRHAIYRYTVPHDVPSVSTIPLWMLLYWGMILRFLATLFRWQRLSPPAHVRDGVQLGTRRIGGAAATVAVQLAIVVVTRQLVYRWYADPILSWLPFALALAVYALLFRPDRHDRALMALFALGGPLVEALYIQLGGLHEYRLGWLAGVPVWIALWWILAALIWKDLSARLQQLATESAPRGDGSHARAPGAAPR